MGKCRSLLCWKMGLNWGGGGVFLVYKMSVFFFILGEMNTQIKVVLSYEISDEKHLVMF